MIISASYRTDIPAFYGAWFMNRLAAGDCRVANPYGGPDYTVALTREAVDGFVFWTKNAGPFLDHLPEVRRRGFPFVVQLTITGYPRALEASVPEPARAAAQLHAIAARFGARAALWRYDPILLTSATETDWHRATFARLAQALRGATDEVVVSFASFYAKTKTNLAAAARRRGFTWREPEIEEQRALLLSLATIAADAGLRLTLCAQPELVVAGTEAARCIDAARLSDVAGRAIAAPRKGNRPGCACAESRDIGAYDSCPHGCVYCYAVRRPAQARDRFRAHDPASDCLTDRRAKVAAAG
jgi:hypothetical protein